MFAKQSQADGGAKKGPDPWDVISDWPSPKPGKKGEGGEVGLRAEVRWAWVQLYRRIGLGQPLSFTASWLGEVSGSRSDARKAGKRYLASLERNGLIEISPERYRGQVTVRLLDPAEAWLRIRREIEAEQGFFPDFEPPRETEPKVVQFQTGINESAKAEGMRPQPAAGDKNRGEEDSPPVHQPLPQRPDPATRTPGSSSLGRPDQPADLAQEPPAVLSQEPPLHVTSIGARAQLTSNINISVRDRDVSPGINKAAVLGQDPPRRSAGDVASGIYADLDEKDRARWAQVVAESQAIRQQQSVSTSEQAKWIDELVKRMWRWLGDDRFGKSPEFPDGDGEKLLWKFARDAWFDRGGSKPLERAFLDALEDLDLMDGSGRLTGTRAGYFMGCLKKIYRDADVPRPPWPLTKKANRGRPI